MSIVFYHNNLAKTATITASSENAQYPVSNINDDRRTKVFRSTSNSDNIVFDLGSAESVEAICLAPNWQTGFGFTGITIEANATDSWGSPAFSTVLSFDSTFQTSITELSSAQEYRFWRFVITSTLGYCEISNVFIGSKVDISTNGIVQGLSYENMDLVNKSTSEYGQEFIDDIAQQKMLNNMSYETMTTAEIEQFYGVYDNVRSIKPFWVRFKNPDSIFTDEDRYSGIYKFTRVSKVTINKGGFFSVGFNLIEQK